MDSFAQVGTGLGTSGSSPILPVIPTEAGSGSDGAVEEPASSGHENNRFLHSAVAYAPAPVGMTKSSLSVEGLVPNPVPACANPLIFCLSHFEK